ncbi:Serum amyloid P-component [Merluccius polli]|uniref:Pentraxin family member n=1 Tax=Merluccius polli TaxID=89951 RepID=A0AA47MRR0_MERPO|nr:Serum amyloid P-component [Merluccius polli]
MGIATVPMNEEVQVEIKLSNLSDMMFTFPKETNTDHVKLLTKKTNFKAVTACLRIFTDVARDAGIFSLATRSHINAFGIFKNGQASVQTLAQRAWVDFPGMTIPMNKWVSICTTWTSETGLTQVWLNGQPSTRKFVHKGLPITSPIITTLGQEQDSFGGGFDKKQSFVGMISDVHMWDYVLSPCQLRGYANDLYFTPGNVLNWRAMEYQIIGNVLEELKQDQCKA